MKLWRMSKYAGSGWQRLLAGVLTVVGLGAETPDDGEPDDEPRVPDEAPGETPADETPDENPPDESPDDDEPDDDNPSDDAEGAAGTLAFAGLAALLADLTSSGVLMRIAKVIIGGVLVITGFVRMTGTDSAIADVARKLPVIPV